MGLIAKIFGDPNEKIVRTLEPIVSEINQLEKKFEAMSDQELKDFTLELKTKIGVNTPGIGFADEQVIKKLDLVLPEAFAAIREAARRVIGKRHYDVQLLGGIVLHRGQIAEMKTGEGKTLVATLPLYLNALTGWGVQLVTVNDYLSKVGAGWMAPVYYALGLSTGVIIHDQALVYDPNYIDEKQFDERLKNFRPVRRKEAYACDILYGTNNEFGFDYLRDNMVGSLEQMVQRPLYFTIVDEVDSILIDEARTPLIISAPAEESTDKYFKFAQLVERLVEDEDYNVDEKMRATTLTESGINKMEKWLGVDNVYTTGGISDVHHIEQALKARVLFKRDRDYVVREGEVIIVDEFTGRMMQGRRYSEGLHQAIEAKEGVEVQRESQTLATVTFQNYFRMYKKLAGMTGTAVTEAEEFHKIYKLETTVIPTHRAMVRKDLNDLIYRTEEGKFKAVIEEVKVKNALGQPILIGTISIEKNEILSLLMEREGLKPQMLNAKNHQREAEIIANAGKVGAITLATNMAGRGVDIMLGGVQPDDNDPAFAEWKIEHDKVVALGGLHVIGTERHEARRIDNQLRGRAGRQGDPGSSQFYVSTEDDLMRIFGGDRMKNMMATLRLPEDMPIENKLISRSIESAQKKVEGNNFDIRKHLVEYDDVINKHRESIYRKRREILEASGQGSILSIDEEHLVEGQEIKGQKLEGASEDRKLSEIILEMVENEIEQVVSFHTAAESISEWNIDEVYQVVHTIFPVEEKLKTDLANFTGEGNKLDQVKARTAIIEHLVSMSQNIYEKLKKQASEAGLNWLQVEKEILIRSIDTLWIEHLEAMASLRQGIGLRGYGQRDPLIEYKREAFTMYNELNNLIQKQVVYSIYKIGGISSFAGPSLADRATSYVAPAKEMQEGNSVFGQTPNPASNNPIVHQKIKDEDGNKVGRNDACPCGSGKKHKKCCGK
ncbi:MAG: Protein translocase subunit SecA [Parcubacteria group bacterium GW2011_GWE2_38_18]|nr:MAG: Protein translocase subunit SecA [Parcubacteria group bacterium GW2011_GWE2_38_18]